MKNDGFVRVQIVRCPGTVRISASEALSNEILAFMSCQFIGFLIQESNLNIAVNSFELNSSMYVCEIVS